jgi:hypothetical protein
MPPRALERYGRVRLHRGHEPRQTLQDRGQQGEALHLLQRADRRDHHRRVRIAEEAEHQVGVVRATGHGQ